MPKTIQITIADDDADMIVMVERLLSRAIPGVQLHSFSEPVEALHHIHTVATDLLITNHGMGTMTGTELIRELRKEHQTLPIIMISHSPNVHDEAIAAGANEFLDKKDLFTQLVHRAIAYLPNLESPTDAPST